MPQHETITDWINHLREGSDPHAAKLWNHFVHRLVGLAQKKLGSGPKGIADEEDVVVQAMNSFLVGVRNDRFPELDDRNDLWQVLAMMVDRKAKDQLRWNWAAKRAADKTLGESAIDGGGSEGGHGFAAQAGVEPSPAFVHESLEELERLFGLLNKPELVKIALLKIEGLTVQEIAGRVGSTRRTTERSLSIIRDTWKGELKPGSPSGD